MTKQYIGDGVYVEVERDMLKLTAQRGESGLVNPDTIYLEKQVFCELVKYARALELEYELRRVNGIDWKKDLDDLGGDPSRAGVIGKAMVAIKDALEVEYALKKGKQDNED
jgi:hypothetical protein